MGGLWNRFWWRALCVCGLVFVINVIVPLLAIELFVLSARSTGPLDFAGGSIVHFHPMPLFLAPPWLAVEAYNLRRKTPMPFGSYIAFAIAFAVILQMTAYILQIPLHEWSLAAMMFLVVDYALACGAGLAAGWSYARLIGKKTQSAMTV